jgi:acetyl-CoA C-acetyltransferase
MNRAVIVGAARTPVAKFNGALKDHKAIELGSLVVRDVIRRAQIDPKAVDEVILGNVIQAGQGQNPARQTALGAGLPDSIACLTVNKVCGSSLKATMLAAQAIRAGDAELVIAGGMESMTNAPYLLDRARFGYRLGHAEIVDSMLRDGLLDAYAGYHMGVTGEIVADEFKVTREDADAFALRSHKAAASATDGGHFKEEVVPVPSKAPGGAAFVADEGIRRDTSIERLSKLRPAFKDGGIVTAGNSSQISDGGSAVVVASEAYAKSHGLDVMAKIVDYTTSGTSPERVMAAPIPGVKALLKKTGLIVNDLDLFEHNEAFATASVAVMRECGVAEDRFNVNGGAVALGHPLGASGTRVLTTLIYALKKRNGSRGLATLCLGGGNAVQMIVERP